MVAIFGCAVIPLGIVSIALVIMQPLVIGQWCTLCLVAAGAMLVMIALSLDEVVAMIQFLAKSHRAGKPWRRVFWTGGTLPDARETPRPDRQPAWRPSAMAWGMTARWNLVLSSAVGIWLLFAPVLLGTQGESGAADNDRLIGALVITIAVIAWAEVARPVRSSISFSRPEKSWRRMAVSMSMSSGGPVLSTDNPHALQNQCLRMVYVLLCCGMPRLGKACRHA